MLPTDSETELSFEKLEARVAMFKELLAKNEELLEYDINLTDLQHSVLAHLVERIQATPQSFDQDYCLFKDICQVYKGNFYILEEPTEFVPVLRTPTMLNLLDAETLFILENQTRVRVGANRFYKFFVRHEERRFFMTSRRS